MAGIYGFGQYLFKDLIEILINFEETRSRYDEIWNLPRILYGRLGASFRPLDLCHHIAGLRMNTTSFQPGRTFEFELALWKRSRSSNCAQRSALGRWERAWRLNRTG